MKNLILIAMMLLLAGTAFANCGCEGETEDTCACSGTVDGCGEDCCDCDAEGCDEECDCDGDCDGDCECDGDCDCDSEETPVVEGADSVEEESACGGCNGGGCQ